MSLLTSCRGCGAPVQENSGFCASCGLSTGNAAPAPSPAATQVQPVVAAQAGTAVPAGGGAGIGSTHMRTLALAAVAALIMGVVAGFVNAKDAAPKGQIVAQMPVGPQGGTVPFDNGGKVEVPAGALSETEEVVVYKTVIEEEVTVTPPAGGPPLIFPAGTLPIYVFGPFGLNFLVPVTIIIPLPPGLVGQVFLVSGGQLQFVNSQIVGNTVVVQVRGFGPGRLVVV